MKKAFATLLILSFPLIIHSQDLTCKDFKQGKFYTLLSDSKNVDKKSYIIRNLDHQIEYSKGKDSIYVNIKWITDCSARLTYDTTKMPLTKTQQWTQNNNGIVINMTTIQGKCMNYQALMTTSNGGKIGHRGKICID